MVSLYSGDIVLGYKIWYIDSLYIEAECHAVWKKPDDTLVDISFYPDREDRILFIPAPNLDGVIIEDHLKPRAGFHPKVEKFIRRQRENERRFSIARDDTWDGWQKALSYEEWQKQMLNLYLTAA